MKKNDVQYSLEQFQNAFNRLKEAILQAGEDELKQDGALQRFEFTFELLWKTLKRYLEFLGKRAANPRDTLKEALREELFTDEKTFLDMLEDRNTCSHTYDFATTRKIFEHIRTLYAPAIDNLIAEIEKRIA